MTPAELKTHREALGLTVGWLAEQARVGERTVRYWESGRNAVPEDVADLIRRIEMKTRAMVTAALDSVGQILAEEGGSPESVDLRRYASDAELWSKHPAFRPLPATWHAVTLARIARELDARGIHSVIEYAN
ncbi:MAG: hypothetical protein BGP25_05305 [Lysobacterales bacterium 63-13]|nr:MAG: hypothetical protein BGP25_05305 [Xanthomonadales bacterium 63-13]